METSFNAPEPDPSQRPAMSSVDREPTPSTAPSRWDLARRRLGLMLNDKWHLDELLGVGGMAAVYAATHRNGSRVAIKLLPFSLATGPEVCQRLLREGYLANRIVHPAVVRVLDDHIDYEREHAYLVMDLLLGETARQRFDSLGTFSPIAAIDLMLELADCLHAAHAANVIHRDIKPENLFLTENGLKVLDFGIARALDGNSSLTQTGTSLGTPAYMSPEQARGKQTELSVRSDIYSVGATLLFLLTGETLHTGENPMELMVKVAWTPAPSAALVCPSLPAPIVEVIDRCCAFESADRYPDSHALQQALNDARAQLGALPSEPPARWSERPASVRPVSTWPREPSVPPDAETVGVATETKDNKRWIGVALAAVALLAGGILLNRHDPNEAVTTPALQPSNHANLDQANVIPQATLRAPNPDEPARALPAAQGHPVAQGLPVTQGLSALVPATALEPADLSPHSDLAASPPLPKGGSGSAPKVASAPSSPSHAGGDDRGHGAEPKLPTAQNTNSSSPSSVQPGSRAETSPTANFDDARPSSAANARPSDAEPSSAAKKGLKPLRYDAFRKGSEPPPGTP